MKAAGLRGLGVCRSLRPWHWAALRLFRSTKAESPYVALPRNTRIGNILKMVVLAEALADLTSLKTIVKHPSF